MRQWQITAGVASVWLVLGCVFMTCFVSGTVRTVESRAASANLQGIALFEEVRDRIDVLEQRLIFLITIFLMAPITGLILMKLVLALLLAN